MISIERSLIHHNFLVRLALSLEGVCPGPAENCRSSRISGGWSQMCSVSRERRESTAIRCPVTVVWRFGRIHPAKMLPTSQTPLVTVSAAAAGKLPQLDSQTAKKFHPNALCWPMSRLGMLSA